MGAVFMTNSHGTYEVLQNSLCGLQVTRNCEFPNIRRREALGNNYAESKSVIYLPNSAEESITHELEVYGHISRR